MNIRSSLVTKDDLRKASQLQSGILYGRSAGKLSSPPQVWVKAEGFEEARDCLICISSSPFTTRNVKQLGDEPQFWALYPGFEITHTQE